MFARFPVLRLSSLPAVVKPGNAPASNAAARHISSASRMSCKRGGARKLFKRDCGITMNNEEGALWISLRQLWAADKPTEPETGASGGGRFTARRC